VTIVAGVDFGTQSVRVSLVDHSSGVIGSGVAECPVRRDAADPDFATQAHADQVEALVAAMRGALRGAGARGDAVRALAVDTTGSSVIVVGEGLAPLGDYYLWCDHRAKDEALRITEVAREEKVPAIELCGGTYSSEWGFAKLLHWLRHNPSLRDKAVAALEHCDMAAAVLCGITDPERLPRSVCAMGHKWMWSAEHGGLPPEAFLRKVDPLLAGSHRLLRGRYQTSDRIAGSLCAEWASRLGLKAGIPVPVGALDAHWDAVGSGIAEGDVVNVVGTSTCTMAITRHAVCIPGVCGLVPGSIHPGYVGIEAGLSAVGDIFDAIARRAGKPVGELTRGLDGYRAGQTGLLRLTWDNGDRTVLVNPHLGGITLGWNLSHTARDELFAAIEGTAFHTRLILERLAEYQVPIRRVIHGGGIPQQNETLNRVYANVLGMPVLVPERPITSLGSSIFAFLAAGAFPSVEAAQRALCPPYRVVEPDPREHAVYDRLHALYRSLYFALGARDAEPVAVGRVLPELQALSQPARRG
jgi:L-ribulokinase